MTDSKYDDIRKYPVMVVQPGREDPLYFTSFSAARARVLNDLKGLRNRARLYGGTAEVDLALEAVRRLSPELGGAVVQSIPVYGVTYQVEIVKRKAF